ncbi:hypothetical protein BKA61DRAFT_232690 [Leptodontidium sp. MPI-SDFR-AT-0119]|nr:hypothetical protein BKA61DRAFT_232690 [Leptodontidium sp. MPI-SDFR-AT-0119]
MLLSKTGSPEIIAHILSNCDTFTDVLALTLTCKHVHMIWVENSSTIIHHIAKTTIRCFEDALMAARATEIVIAAYRRGEQPPDPFPIVELGTEFKKPDLVELKAVCNLQHLVRCFEYMFLNPPHGSISADIPNRNDKEGWEVWKDTFYRAAYRSMLVGAVIYKAFNEPFYLAEKEGRTEFVEHCVGPSNQNWEDWLSSITESDIDYLRKFAVYNFDAEDESTIGKWSWNEYKKVFGPLADWLVEDGKIKGVQDKLGQDEPEEVDEVNPEPDEPLQPPYDSAELGVFRDIMLLIATYEHFPNKLTKEYRHDNWKSTESEPLVRKSPRKASVILFGRFCIEEILMPEVVGDVGCLLATQSLAPESAPGSVDILSVIHALQSKSTRPNLHDGRPGPPPIFQFLVYVLRIHFHLKFVPGLFDWWSDSDYAYQVTSGSIFWVTEFTPFVEYSPPVLSYSG